MCTIGVLCRIKKKVYSPLIFRYSSAAVASFSFQFASSLFTIIIHHTHFCHCCWRSSQFILFVIMWVDVGCPYNSACTIIACEHNSHLALVAILTISCTSILSHSQLRKHLCRKPFANDTGSHKVYKDQPFH